MEGALFVDKDLPIAVIGAGAGGLPAAVALAEEGFQVVIIERGAEVSSEHFATDSYDYELRSSPWDEYSSEWKGPVKLQQGFGLGGSTIYFQAVSQLPPESTLSNWGLPIPVIRELGREVSDFLQIAGEVQPAHPLNPVSQHLFDSAKKIGWNIRRAPVAILSRSHQGRPACNYCGLCIYGCRPGDKGSVNNTWLPRLKKQTGRIKILTNTRVDFLELADTKHVKALRVSGHKGSYTLPVSAVVVSAGVMETPYLLKNSRQNLAPEGIGNLNVGRNLTGSIWQSLLLSLPQTKGHGHAGIPLDMLVEEFVDRGILLCQGRNLAGITGPVSAARHYVRHFGNTGIRRWMREDYPKLAGLCAYAESSVAFEDGLNGTGERSFSKPLRQSDHSLIKEMRNLLNRWSEAARAKILTDVGSLEYPFTGAMFRGTCRMGTVPETSAVRPDGRLWGYENIVISDASVLGRGLIAHPSLSLQVLGLHFGRQLANRLMLA